MKAFVFLYCIHEKAFNCAKSQDQMVRSATLYACINHKCEPAATHLGVGIWNKKSVIVNHRLALLLPKPKNLSYLYDVLASGQLSCSTITR